MEIRKYTSYNEEEILHLYASVGCCGFMKMYSCF